MTGRTNLGVSDTRLFQAIWTSPQRRDVLTGLVVVVVVALLGVDGESELHDVFASSAHLRLLADSERQLVPAVRQYVDDERHRLKDIVR